MTLETAKRKQPDTLPWVITPSPRAGLEGNLSGFLSWISERSDEIHRDLAIHGAVLFRGFPVNGRDDLAKVMLALGGKIVPYSGAKVSNEAGEGKDIYSPTSTPGYLKNPLHNEMAYQHDIPSRLILYCDRPAKAGGESLLGDARKIFLSINPEYRERLEARKLKFVRVLISETRVNRYLGKRCSLFALTPTWQTALGTCDRGDAERKCRAKSFDVEWTAEGHLRLSTVISPVRRHPQTGEKLWVNNAHLFQLHPRVYGVLMTHLFRAYFKLTDRPMTTCVYADNDAPLEKDVIDNILDAGEVNSVVLPLQHGDFVYLDNYAVSHGRLPFRGKRRLWFAMFE